MTKNPLIIVEGPDACGKTTWAKAFRKRYGGRYFHMTLKKDMPKYQQESFDFAKRWASNVPVVIDRHWPSEVLYGRIYRGGTPHMEKAKHFGREFVRLGAVYVICRLSSSERMVQSLAKVKRRELYAPDQRFADLAKAYMKWSARRYRRYVTWFKAEKPALPAFGQTWPDIWFDYEYNDLQTSLAAAYELSQQIRR